MKLDKPEHRALLLELLDHCTFSGSLRREIFALGEAIAAAEIEPPAAGPAVTVS